jgi:hypothetical protein
MNKMQKLISLHKIIKHSYIKFFTSDHIKVHKFGNKWSVVYSYHSDIPFDKECEKLCNAINLFPDTLTGTSCSGHNKSPLEVTFSTTNLNVLSTILFATGLINCSNNSSWTIDSFVIKNVLHKNKFELCYRLKTTAIGQEAYEIAEFTANKLFGKGV